MGYIEGLLGGFTGRQAEVRAQNRADAERSQAREDAVLQHLVNSPDPEIKSLAVAGILESANPKRKKSGLAGWLGQMQANPHLDRIRALVDSDAQAGGMPETGASPEAGVTPPVHPGGAITTPTAGPPLAQSASSPTEVGSPPPTMPQPSTAAGPDDQVEPLPGHQPTINAQMFQASPGPTSRGQEIQAEAAQAGPDATAAVAPVPAVTGPPPALSGPTGPAPRAVLGQPPVPSAVDRQTPKGGGTGGRKQRQVFQSPEGQIRSNTLATGRAKTEAELERAKAIGFSPEEYKDLEKAKARRAGGIGATGFQSVGGEVVNPETGAIEQVFGAFDRPSGRYIGTDPDSAYYGIPIPGFRPKATAAGQPRSYGQDREAIAKAKYGKQFKELDQAQAADVMQEEKTTLTGKAKARGAGAGQAAFEKPIGVSEAQRTNTQVGSSSANYQGQEIPSEVEQGRLRSVANVKSQLQHVQTLLGVLPKKTELGGVAPGATLAIRRRSNATREQVAALESALDGIIATLSRTVQDNRGSQTEQDASRAYNTVVAMKASLLDPLAGDTQESAAARINETLKYLDIVQGTLPGAPTPTPGVGTAPPGPGGGVKPSLSAPPKPTSASAGAGPAGFTMVGGQLYKDGKPF